ncbi:unnamed protein product, partial [Brassica rapa]
WSFRTLWETNILEESLARDFFVSVLLLRNVTRCNDSSPIMANPSIILSDFQACCCSSTVKVSDFGKLARWRADGVDVLLLSWLFSHGELIATNLTQMEIHNGASTSFWFDVWDVWYPLGKLINLTGLRGCIDLGLHIQVTGICSAVLSLQKKQRRASNYN